MHYFTIIALSAFLLLATTTTTSEAQKIYGVNLGGWLLLERFITPSLLVGNDPRIHDEYTLAQFSQNKTLFEHHWDTFVQRDDLTKLKKAGITHVRIPVGYWSLCTEQELAAYNEPYFVGAWTYLDRAIGWCKEEGLKVMIDLHGAPGSQNGWDNSGKEGDVLWGTDDTVNRTLDILDRLAQRIAAFDQNPATSDTVVALGVLNEPFYPRITGGLELVQRFYSASYPVVRKHLSADKYMIVFDQAFTIGDWIGWMPTLDAQNIVMDFHSYQCFSDALRRASFVEHLVYTCEQEKNKVIQQTLPVVTGEWSFAYKVESNFAHLEPMPNATEQFFMKRFALAQMHAYEVAPNGIGWFFWNFKTEQAVMWNYLLAVEKKWIPKLPAQEPVTEGCTNYLEWTLPTSLSSVNATFTASDSNGTTPTGTNEDPIQTQDDIELNSAIRQLPFFQSHLWWMIRSVLSALLDW